MTEYDSQTFAWRDTLRLTQRGSQYNHSFRILCPNAAPVVSADENWNTQHRRRIVCETWLHARGDSRHSEFSRYADYTARTSGHIEDDYGARYGNNRERVAEELRRNCQADVVLDGSMLALSFRPDGKALHATAIARRVNVVNDLPAHLSHLQWMLFDMGYELTLAPATFTYTALEIFASPLDAQKILRLLGKIA